MLAPMHEDSRNHPPSSPSPAAAIWPAPAHGWRSGASSRSRAVVPLIAMLLACSGPEPLADAGRDAGTVDASTADASTADASTPGLDASTADAATTGDAGTSRTPCWPFDQPPIDSLRASPRKVFAHYFSPYPISLDNQPAETDYYTRNYLDPDGEGGIHRDYGGLLRERPWPRPPWPAGSEWEVLDMETEVRRAIAIGLDGFAFDVLNPNPSSPHRRRLDALLTAVERVDPGFSIQLILDMTASSFGGSGGSDEAAMNGIRTLFDAVGSSPVLQRLDDGRLVVSAFAAERRSAAFWNDALAELEAMGHRVAFVPMPIGSWPSNRDRFDGVPLYGASSWGSGTVSGAEGLRNVIAGVHADGLVWMAPVRPQDSRPKAQTYVESSNSAAYRAQWLAAIEGGADWVQIITWNDYSEDSEIAPSTRINAAFYDLAAYYTTWLKTGSQPPIARDALYYFHRTHSIDPTVAVPSAMVEPFRAVNGPPGEDFIEVVGLLRAPATLEIEIGGETHRQDVGAGVQSFRIPLVEGTPVFRVLRGGAVALELTSASPISNTIAYQDPLYHAGGSSTCAM